MRILRVFLLRHWRLTVRRRYLEVGAAFGVPMVLWVAAATALRPSVDPTLVRFDYSSWVVPGLVLTLVLIHSILPSLLDASRSSGRGYLTQMGLAPESGITLVAAWAGASAIAAFLRSLAALAVLLPLSGTYGGVVETGGIAIHALLASFVCATLSVTAALWAGESLSRITFSAAVAFALVFASGWLIPLRALPESLFRFFSFLPTSLLGQAARDVFFDGDLHPAAWAVSLSLVGAVTYLNGWLFDRIARR